MLFKRDLQSVTIIGIIDSLRYRLADKDLKSLSLAPLSAIYISLLSGVDKIVSIL
jgi:hypothetical protein